MPNGTNSSSSRLQSGWIHGTIFTSRVKYAWFPGKHPRCSCSNCYETKCNQPSLYSLPKVPAHQSQKGHSCQALARSSRSWLHQKEITTQCKITVSYGAFLTISRPFISYYTCYMWGIRAQMGNTSSKSNTMRHIPTTGIQTFSRNSMKSQKCKSHRKMESHTALE